MDDAALELMDVCIRYKGLKTVSLKRGGLRLGAGRTAGYEAVRHVTLSVPRGSILGIVGRNGSGKSTLLNAIAGIFSPDSGSIDRKGNSVSLLSIGVGFQRELSGRDNILLSGMLLGFSRRAVLEKMEEIIAFAELGDFIEAPVRAYSSGMYSKLAFSITAILETDIILIDEVLSVGDARFKKKSYQKMRELILDKDRTVLIVSHAMDTMRQLCHQVLWMHGGAVRMAGGVEEVLGAYEEFMR